MSSNDLVRLPKWRRPSKAGHDEDDTVEMEGKRVGEALRRIAEGESVRSVTDPTSVHELALVRLED